MRYPGLTVFSILLLASGCSGPARVASPLARGTAAGATPVGPPPLIAAAGAEDAAIGLPDRITLPAAYRLMLVDGHMTLVRETDPKALEGAPASLRIVAGEAERGELAYQPGLLPQELASEVAANRESSARMDNALADVMKRSRELTLQAQELQAQSRKLSEMLASALDRVAQLEADGRPAAPGPAKADPQN